MTITNRSILPIIALGLGLAMNAKAIDVTVSGASGPWDVALNPTYAYGVPVDGIPNVNLAPSIVDSSSGLALTPGDTLTITSLTPGAPTLLAVSGWNPLFSDANGVPSMPTTGGAGTPGFYIPGPTFLEELVGTFANNGVIVGTPFAIGNGPTTVTIAPGCVMNC